MLNAENSMAERSSACITKIYWLELLGLKPDNGIFFVKFSQIEVCKIRYFICDPVSVTKM